MSTQSEIMSALRQIAAERKIDVEIILDVVKEGIKNSFKEFYEADEISVELDPEAGSIAVYARKEVVKKVEEPIYEISISDATEIDDSIKVGEEVMVEITTEGDFGRIAAQGARQAILQNLREIEKTSAIEALQDKIGGIETVTIQRITRDGDVLCEINRAKAVMPKDERVPTEFYKLGSRVKVLLKSIEEDQRGKYILISRADKGFLHELFRIEVPEIDSGTVEIVSIAREAGSRSKVAVKSNSDGIDPIGSCIGQRGVRINAIMNELKMGNYEEKVDVILFEEDTEIYLANAIRPAEAIEVDLNDEIHEATIKVDADQHSLAIGAGGQNVRLANVLTGWDINIISEGGEEEESSDSEPTSEEVNENESSQDAEASETEETAEQGEAEAADEETTEEKE